MLTMNCYVHINMLIACCSFYSIHILSQKISYGSESSLSITNSRTYPQRAYMNVIDSCWRSNKDWANNRQSLADCVIGFGAGATGGKNGALYVVYDGSDNPIYPSPGTLRYGVIQSESLWIIFAGDMVINLENDLLVNSFKTIDGRGANVEISHGPCIVIEEVSNVIIHGIRINDCKRGNTGFIRKSPGTVIHRDRSDGDGITIKSSLNIWIDHCFLARCTDGLIDVTHASTYITISNNYFTQHDKVMLLGHSDDYTEDKAMKVTIVFNHFGPGLSQRMPRVRFGYAHVANNKYDEWLMYAIGGSADPTILSDGNLFVASNNPKAKQTKLRDESLIIFLIIWRKVTQRETGDNWRSWNWRSVKDQFENGAYFYQTGWGTNSPYYTPSQLFDASHGFAVPYLTAEAGPLRNYIADEQC